MSHDYGDDAEQPSESTKEKMGKIVVRVLLLEREIEQDEERLKEKKKELEKYEKDQLPVLMDDLGTTLWGTKAGLKVELKEELRGSFPKDEARRREAFDYLIKDGNEGYIRHEVVINLGRDSHETVRKILDFLKAEGIDKIAEVTHGETINHQQMMAYLREELRNSKNEEHEDFGKEVPLELFGTFVERIAKIKLK